METKSIGKFINDNFYFLLFLFSAIATVYILVVQWNIPSLPSQFVGSKIAINMQDRCLKGPVIVVDKDGYEHGLPPAETVKIATKLASTIPEIKYSEALSHNTICLEFEPTQQVIDQSTVDNDAYDQAVFEVCNKSREVTTEHWLVVSLANTDLPGVTFICK